MLSCCALLMCLINMQSVVRSFRFASLAKTIQKIRFAIIPKGTFKKEPFLIRCSA